MNERLEEKNSGEDRLASNHDIDSPKQGTKEDEESNLTIDPETDAGSEKFNPLKALYAKDFRVTRKSPKVQYQNIAAFESALKRLGVWSMQQNPGQVNAGQSTSKKALVKEDHEVRRFLPHQMPIKAPAGSGMKDRHKKNIWKAIENMQGPLKALSDSLGMQRKVKVVIRNEHGVRGYVEGNVICFDKHWNLLLKNVKEVWRRRKYKYGVNKTCEAENPIEDCTARLQELGITDPQQTVKSLNRKNIEITRFLEQLLVRGEQIVLINIITTTGTKN